MTEYIRREDLMERVGRWQLNTREAIAEMIMSVPSADVVERKRGKWIGDNDVDYVRCGCCHKNYDWVSQAQYYNYCPHCGADMRRRKDERSD